MLVKKESGSGMFKNERLLLIKEGYISYYSKKPKCFVGNVRSLELSGELPKMTLSASDVLEMTQNGRVFEMTFEEKKLIDSSTLAKFINSEITEEDLELKRKKREGEEFPVL